MWQTDEDLVEKREYKNPALPTFDRVYPSVAITGTVVGLVLGAAVAGASLALIAVLVVAGLVLAAARVRVWRWFASRLDGRGG